MSVRSVAQVALTLAFVCFVLFNYEAASIPQGLLKIPFSTYVLALILITSTLFLSSVRFFLLLRDLGFQQTFATSFHINAMSLLGNLVFFNYFGQSLTRYSLLSHVDGSPAMAFILTGLERVVALVSLFFMALVSAFWLFGSVHIEFNKAAPGLFLFFNLSVVVLGVAWFGVRRQIALLRRVSTGTVFWPLLRISLVTIVMHISMLSAFLVLARELASDASFLVLAAVSAIVMLASALPISFAGWGVRELSAAFTFDFVGLAPESGLTLGVAVGLISLLALAINLILGLVFRQNPGQVTIAKSIGDNVGNLGTKLISWGIPILVATLILFQTRLETHTGWVTLNLADPFAIVGGITFALVAFAAKEWNKVWKIQGVNLALVVGTVAIALAFLHGWTIFGATDWALYNRLVGWFLLLGYLLAGALITQGVGRIGLQTVARVYIVACVAIIITELFLRFGSPAVGLHFKHFYAGKVFPGFSGMVGNPNAFGLQLVLAASIGLAGQCFWVGRYGPALQNTFLGVIFAGVVFTGSRAAALALIVIVLGSLLLRRSNIRQVMAVLGVGLAILLVVTSVKKMGVEAMVRPKSFAGVQRITTLQDDRRESMVVGWKMFTSHPIFGAGLGSYMQDHLKKTGIPFVIHNSYLWLLAEFGIVGFLAFLIIPTNVLLWVWRNRAWIWEWDWTIVGGLGCLVAFGVMSLAHELVYQRIVWFICGAMFAVPKCIKNNIGFPKIKGRNPQKSIQVLSKTGSLM